MGEQFFVYILASKKHGTLYIGMTNDLVRRVFEHKNKLADGFTKQYDVTLLVHFEIFGDHPSAVQRERNMKEWQRSWKIRLIEENNPDWRDLYADITQ